jgi:hypothetical protein
VAWRGSARAATTTPSQGKMPMTRWQGTTRTSTRSRQGKGRAARGEARGHHGQNPRCRRRQSRGHREAIGKISRTSRCAIAGSIERTPSQWLALAGAVEIEHGGGDGDSVARARERGKERGNAQTGWVGSDRATWSGSTRWAGAYRWARAQQVGQEEFLIRNQNKKLQGKIKGFRKTF